VVKLLQSAYVKMENDSVKQRINGNYMQTFIGQHVIMVGHLINVSVIYTC